MVTSWRLFVMQSTACHPLSISDTRRLSRTPGGTRQDGLTDRLDKTVSPTVLSLTWESSHLGKTVFILKRGPGACSQWDIFLVTTSTLVFGFSYHDIAKVETAWKVYIAFTIYNFLVYVCNKNMLVARRIYSWSNCGWKSFVLIDGSRTKGPVMRKTCPWHDVFINISIFLAICLERKLSEMRRCDTNVIFVRPGSPVRACTRLRLTLYLTRCRIIRSRDVLMPRNEYDYVSWYQVSNITYLIWSLVHTTLHPTESVHTIQKLLAWT